MPIKGLSENRRLPRVGKLHLGIKVEKDGKTYPKAVDYIVCRETLTNGDPNPHYNNFVAVFGQQPRAIRIMFPLDDEEQVLSQYYRCYSKTRGLVCKGDGEVANRMIDAETGDLANRDSKAVEWKNVPCQGTGCPDYVSKRCREIMNIQFMIPELPGIGIWQLDTSSINTIKNLNGAVTFIKGIYKRLSFIPLILQMEQIEVTPEDGKKKKVWVLNLTTPTNLADSARLAAQSTTQLLAAMGPKLLLPAPDDETPDLLAPDADSPNGFSEAPADAVPVAEVAQAEQDAKAYWPDGDAGPPPAKAAGTKAVAKKKAVDDKADMTFQDLLDKVKAKGATYTESWLFRNLGMSVDEAKADPKRAWQEICSVAGW